MAAVGAVLCVALVVAGTAGAGSFFQTDVTIKEQNGDFHGKVKSEGGFDCVADRTVYLYKKRDGADRKITFDVSDVDGDWDTGNTHVGRGRYYARAKAVDFAGGGGCRKGKSETVTVN